MAQAAAAELFVLMAVRMPVLMVVLMVELMA